jgi:hypothetical protein
MAETGEARQDVGFVADSGHSSELSARRPSVLPTSPRKWTEFMNISPLRRLDGPTYRKLEKPVYVPEVSLAFQ